MTNSNEVDRRVRPREKTSRGAQCFERTEGTVHTGRVVDISANGMQIELGAPVVAGASYDIEVAARPDTPDAAPFQVRGEVVWCYARGAGTFAAGVRIYMPMDVASRDAVMGSAEAASRLADFQASLATLRDPGSLMPLSAPADRMQLEATPRRSLRRRAIVILLLFLFLGFMGALLQRRGVDQAAVPADGYTPERSVREMGADALGDRGVEGAVEGPRQGEVFDLDLGYHLFLQGDWAGAEAIFDALEGRQHLSPTERFLVAAGRAQVTYASGQTGKGLIQMRQALAEAPAEFPEAWRAAGVEMLEELPQNRAGVVPLWGLQRRAGLVPAPSEQEDGAEPVALALEIDLSEFLLRVYRNGVQQAVMPVGVGELGMTPVGSFRVSNMIRNPVWYNRGEPIAPGDPENPLGETWMGLGQGGRALPYGLHPTAEGDSIGAAKSAGCIRLRPGDAERLFEQCSVGTPVRIVP